MKPEDLVGKLISVTQSDIAGGKRGDCTRCPVALAVKRCCLTDTAAAGLNLALIWVSRWQTNAAYKLPESVREFIRRFDHGESVEPFEFTLGPAQLPRPFPEERS